LLTVDSIYDGRASITIKQLLTFFLGYNLETGFNRVFLALGGIKLAILYHKYLSIKSNAKIKPSLGQNV
jgi:hypothetical protein